MTDLTALKKALMARRRELIARLAAGVDATGFADAGTVKMLAETHTALEAIESDEAWKLAR
jgi:hypothetical protein